MLPVRAFAVATALLFPAPAANVEPLSNIEPGAFVQVICVAKEGVYSGTAFRVGNGLMLSVNHVTSSGNCTINGTPISIDYKSPSADFSMLHSTSGPFLTVDCGGFVKDRKYLAVGFARGVSPATVLEATATGDMDHGEAILVGLVPVIPGMSGGALIDEETGKVVGVINAENFEDGISWSVPLSSTPVCKGHVA